MVKNTSSTYIVRLSTAVYGPVFTKQEAVKLAMSHTTYVRRPKIYTVDGKYVGQVIKVKTEVVRKGNPGYHYQFISADGRIGKVVSTTGVIINDVPTNYEYLYKGATYVLYPEFSGNIIGKANTANKARLLAISLLNESNWKIKIAKFGKTGYTYFGDVYLASKDTYRYLPYNDEIALKRFARRASISIDPDTGELFEER